MALRGRRHAPNTSLTLRQFALGAVSVVRGARGDCADARPWLWRSSHGKKTRSRSVNYFSLTPAQRCNPGRRLWLPRNDRSVACGAHGASAQSGEAGVARFLAPLCAGASCRSDHSAGPGVCRRAEGPMERASERAKLAVRAVGESLEPGALSLDQISRRLELDFPEGAWTRIRHEAIYQSHYIQGRGALRQELTACLRTGRALRVLRARCTRPRQILRRPCDHDQRTPEADDRAVPGRWEGDPILGLNRSAIGTLVERTMRVTMLRHRAPVPGHGTDQGQKHGPALVGHGAEAVQGAVGPAPLRSGQATTLGVLSFKGHGASPTQG
jgi:hypothetical protein